MVRTISAQEAQTNFRELLDSVRRTNKPIVVEESGAPLGAVIGSDDLEEFLDFQVRQAHERLDQLAQRNAGIDPDEALRIVTEEVEAVRNQMWKQRQRG